MRFPSDLLFRFARSVRNGSVDEREAELVVPNQILPVVTLPGPQTDLSNFVSTVLQRESWIAAIGQTQAPSAAAVETTLATLAAGLWDILIGLDTVCDFTNIGPTASGGSARIGDDDGTTSVLVRLPSVANVPQHFSQRYILLIPEDNWTLSMRIEATGVAQNAMAFMSGHANRLT